MSNQLRSGLEKLKSFYIDQLLNSKLYSKQELCTLTISELKNLYKQKVSTPNYSKENSS